MDIFLLHSITYYHFNIRFSFLVVFFLSYVNILLGGSMELENQFRYLVGGYYGVGLMDEYPLKVYMMKEIEEYIKAVVQENPIPNFDYKKEAEDIKENMSDKTKLQDALIVLNLIKGPMDLVFLIKERLKGYANK